MSLFLSTPDVFTVDFIIDEVIDFLVAGSLTTAFSASTMLIHLAKSKESIQKVREQFQDTVKSQPDIP